nr:hypothetical protein [Tanacetum cinerariifolium]
MKRIIKGQVKSQVKEQVSQILPRIEESVNAQLKAEVLTRSSHSSKTSYAVAADLTEMELKKILIVDEQEDIESGEGDAEETASDEQSFEEETREEEEGSFDPIPRTPEDSEDDGNDEEDQGLRVSEEQRLIEEEKADELYRDVDINQGRGLQVSQDVEDKRL